MADQDVGINERAQGRDPARWPRVRRRTSSHGVPRLPAGTATVPASSRKLGVFAITARERSRPRAGRWGSRCRESRWRRRRWATPRPGRSRVWASAPRRETLPRCRASRSAATRERSTPGRDLSHQTRPEDGRVEARAHVTPTRVDERSRSRGWGVGVTRLASARAPAGTCELLPRRHGPCCWPS